MFHKVFGPPGTGKTNRLIELVEEALEDGIMPQEIAYLAFTRRASAEAKTRAREKFEQSEDMFFYFRTLHSMAYHLLKIKKQEVLSTTHLKEFAKSISLNNFSSGYDFDSDIITTNDPILNLIQLSRLKQVDLKKEYNDSRLDIPWNVVEYVYKSYKKYLEARKLLDFTSMLERLDQDFDDLWPHFKLILIDECQDLCPLHWSLVKKMNQVKNPPHIYLAGDDDQSIFSFSGASPDLFIDLDSTTSEVLNQSYRVPRSVHRLAETITSRIGNRIKKTYNPRKVEGQVKYINELYQVDFSHGNFLILSLTNFQLSKIAEELKSGGFLYEKNGSRSIPLNMATAIRGWETLRNGKEVDGGTLKHVYKFLSGNNKSIKRGFKKLSHINDDDLFTFDLLVSDFGLLVSKDKIWSSALDLLPHIDRAYITAFLRRGEKINAQPRIKLSTIHSAKGSESDTVVLFLDISLASQQESFLNPDILHRVFYVGVTRTREKLFVVNPQHLDRSYQL